MGSCAAFLPCTVFRGVTKQVKLANTYILLLFDLILELTSFPFQRGLSRESSWRSEHCPCEASPAHSGGKPTLECTYESATHVAPAAGREPGSFLPPAPPHSGPPEKSRRTGPGACPASPTPASSTAAATPTAPSASPGSRGATRSARCVLHYHQVRFYISARLFSLWPKIKDSLTVDNLLFMAAH